MNILVIHYPYSTWNVLLRLITWNIGKQNIIDMKDRNWLRKRSKSWVINERYRCYQVSVLELIDQPWLSVLHLNSNSSMGKPRENVWGLYLFIIHPNLFNYRKVWKNPLTTRASVCVYVLPYYCDSPRSIIVRSCSLSRITFSIVGNFERSFGR